MANSNLHCACAMRLAVSLLFLVLPTVVLSKCGSNTDCASCARDKELFAGCVWCVSDGGCHSKLQLDCPATNQIKKPFDCPTQPAPGFEYNETFAREVAIVLTAATNGETPDEVQTCLDKVGATLYKQYTKGCDSSGDTCSGYLGYSSSENAIIMAFRGSKAMDQFISEGIDFIFNKLTSLITVGGKVDTYFFNAWDVMFKAGMETDFKGLVLQYPTANVWVVGHSLGGSMASIASAYIVKKGYTTTEKVRLVTFGQPRTGDTEYAQAHDNAVKSTYRIVHKADPIPHLPAKVFDDLFDTPFHHRFEVWYNNDMLPGDSYSLCDRADDSACSNTVSETEVADHLHYFNKDLSSWAQSGCA